MVYMIALGRVSLFLSRVPIKSYDTAPAKCTMVNVAPPSRGVL